MNPYIIPGLKQTKIPSKYFMISSNISPEKVIVEVCQHYNVEPNRLTTKCRKRDVAFARHTICWIFVRKLGMTLGKVGREYLGGRDHSTVINSTKVFQNMYDTDENFRVTSDLIIENLSTFVGEK